MWHHIQISSIDLNCYYILCVQINRIPKKLAIEGLCTDNVNLLSTNVTLALMQRKLLLKIEFQKGLPNFLVLYNTSTVVQRRIKYLSLGSNLSKIILRKLEYSKMVEVEVDMMYHNLLNMIPTSDNSNKCFSLSDRILTKVNSKNCVSKNSCFCFSNIESSGSRLEPGTRFHWKISTAIRFYKFPTILQIFCRYFCETEKHKKKISNRQKSKDFIFRNFLKIDS